MTDDREERRFYLNQVSYQIVGCAIEVHKVLGGAGLLESVYEEALCIEMALQGLTVERQKHIPIIYKGCVLNTHLRLDIVVNDVIIVECKATLEHHKLFEAQLFTYLKVANLNLGLLLNFGATIMKSGVKRVVNNF